MVHAVHDNASEIEHGAPILPGGRAYRAERKKELRRKKKLCKTNIHSIA